MSRPGSGKARRIEVTGDVRAADTLAGPDYAAAWGVARPAGDLRDAEQWARATFEGAPPALRAVIVAGWRAGLGLRLGPRRSADHVMGWSMVRQQTDLVILTAPFRFGTAHNLVRVEKGRVVLATFVRYEKRGGRLIWATAAPIHHRTIPYLLNGAASRPFRAEGGDVTTGT